MPRDSLQQFDTDPTLDTDISGISTAPGWSPANVGPAFRTLMSQLSNYAVPVSIAVSGSVTATVKQATGTLINTTGAGGTLTISAQKSWGWLWNSCTGAVVITTGTSATVSVPAGMTVFWYCWDGAGVASPTLGMPVGPQPSLTVNGPLTATTGTFSGAVVASGEVASAAPGNGSVRMELGGAGNTGYIGFWTPANVRAGYIGFGSGGTLNLQVDPGYTTWRISGTFVDVAANLHVVGAGLTVDGATSTNGVTYFGPSGTFYAQPNNGGNQLLAFAGNQYIQFVQGVGFQYVTGGNHVFTGGLYHGANEVVSNDGRTYAISITGSAASAGGVGWGGVSGVPAQITTLNQYVNSDSDVTHHFITTSTGLINHGTMATDGFAYFAGGTFLSAGGMVIDTGGVSGPRSWNGSFSIQCVNSCAATVFSTYSDGRFKEDITDIAPEDGVAWVLTGRPRRYVMNGKRAAGFIAQEDLNDGWDRTRGESIGQVTSDDQRAAESDGFASDGQRLMRDYQSDSAWLTAALQWALRRISDLEDRIVALEDER